MNHLEVSATLSTGTNIPSQKHAAQRIHPVHIRLCVENTACSFLNLTRNVETHAFDYLEEKAMENISLIASFIQMQAISLVAHCYSCLLFHQRFLMCHYQRSCPASVVSRTHQIEL